MHGMQPRQGERMSDRLSGRVAVITGGASGIGRATGLRIASEGCHVALIDIDEEGALHVAEECASAGVEAKAFGADVSVEAQIEAAIGKVVSHFSRMDILVANAGIEGAMRDFGDITTAEWDRIMAVNVRGAFLTVRSCIPTMRTQHSGAIILTASNYGLVATPHTTAYCTSKGAVAALGRALAMRDGGLLVSPAAPALKDMDRDVGYRDALLGADIAITDSALMVMVWNLLQRDSLHRLSGLTYLRELVLQPDVRQVD